MAGSIPTDNLTSKPEDQKVPSWLRGFHSIENGVLVVCLFALIFLPLVERVLRGFFNTGIEGGAEFVLRLCGVQEVQIGAVRAVRREALGPAWKTWRLRGGF